MAKMKQVLIIEEGEKIKKWVRVDKEGQLVKSQNKLKGKKLWGYSHKDFKEWGKEGGRPRKWTSEAERKREARKKKALLEGRALRGYRRGK